MEFRYSEEIDTSLYETHGLCDGIPLRVHKDSFSEILGSLRAQRDWDRHVSPLYGGYNGNLGERFSFVRVTVPECLPERLETISYANEFAFLYDDEMETLDLKNVDQGVAGAEMLEAFQGTGDMDCNPRDLSSLRPEKRLQAQIFAEMIAIDPVRAKTSMKAWARFVQLASQTRLKPFDTLQEYIPARVIDSGELIWFGTLTFGMALTIPEEECHICMELARPGYAVLGLTNDLYSWEKERDAAERQGQDYVFNAVWVIMKERSVGEEEAKLICGEIIRDYVEEYRLIVENTKRNQRLSKDVRAYIEAVMFSISGNLVWSIYCPRYRHEGLEDSD
ncbi:isoprenoid synthase domain-containing protein [Podospora fimiseda]|uniref:Isoprenoid synthase domain-containing protein n=1 Tax=Podospora fimiseda TaxID=252190 RepID=A0AAN7BFI9_9PEZI|nr:isoprenoid synthase domain-containing protein [Podospora fimiseda]